MPSTTPQLRHQRRLRLAGVLSLPLLILVWHLVSLILSHRLLPSPVVVAERLWQLGISGPLAIDLGLTLSRVAIGFVVAMVLGTGLGLALGRWPLFDRILSAWLVVGLNLPAVVVAILVYVWLGLTEPALILAVVINKVPLVATTIRAGVLALSVEYDELASVLALSKRRRLLLVHIPQLGPFVLAAARNGMALIWKIVLVFEVLGSDGGVGYRVGIYFQFFDIAGILAYTVAFMSVVLALDRLLIAPAEQRASLWQLDRT